MKNKFSCIDLFAGAGGLGEGFKRAGFDILVANDIWEAASHTYKENHKEVKYILKDICNLDGKELLDCAGVGEGEVDLILGGPPCQGFSTVGKRSEDDPRNSLFKEYVRIVNTVRPKMFVMENVTGILSMQGGKVLQDIIKSFSEIGYKLKYEVLNASNYGVPQTRERVIFVGTRLDIEIVFPSPTHSNENNLLTLLDTQPVLTLWDAIGDLPVIGESELSEAYDKEPQNQYQADRRKDCDKLTLHHCGKHSEKLVKMMEYIPEGSSVWEVPNIPEELKPTSGYGNTYARLDSKIPGMTITRNFNCVSSSRCIHPVSHRGLTAREAARIQSFDDKYVFLGSKTDISLQIGNAVPPILAEKIAKAVKKMLEA